MANDITAPTRDSRVRSWGNQVGTPHRVVPGVRSHSALTKGYPASHQRKDPQEFAESRGLSTIDGGRNGFEHASSPEQGLVGPGEVVIGAVRTHAHGALAVLPCVVGHTRHGSSRATGRCG